jgi:hypothetical protein
VAVFHVADIAIPTLTKKAGETTRKKKKKEKP